MQEHLDGEPVPAGEAERPRPARRRHRPQRGARRLDTLPGGHNILIWLQADFRWKSIEILYFVLWTLELDISFKISKKIKYLCFV